MAAADARWPEGWAPPQQWHFPPMFTLQPVAATREQQLRLWRDLIVEFHMASNKYMLVPSQCPLFTNPAINRTLSPQARAEVINYLVADGSAEWEDDAHTRLRVLWRRPDQLAGELYDYICRHDMLETVYTVYELHAGDEFQDAPSKDVDAYLLGKALRILEEQGKCAIFEGATSEGAGVKFFRVAA